MFGINDFALSGLKTTLRDLHWASPDAIDFALSGLNKTLRDVHWASPNAIDFALSGLKMRKQ